MTILTWIILGLVAGWVASLLMGSGGYGLLGNIIVGIVGAIVGGWLGSLLLGLDVTGFNVTSVALSIVGAVIVIVLVRTLVPHGRRFA